MNRALFVLIALLVCYCLAVDTERNKMEKSTPITHIYQLQGTKIGVTLNTDGSVKCRLNSEEIDRKSCEQFNELTSQKGNILSKLQRFAKKLNKEFLRRKAALKQRLN